MSKEKTGLTNRGFLGPYKKPNLTYVDAYRIKVEASSTRPAFFVIGGKVKIIENDLLCSLGESGPGGLIEGVQAATMVYYAYAIEHQSQVKLIVDKRSPLDEPCRGYGFWTYLGAFFTYTNKLIIPFSQSNGHFRGEKDFINTGAVTSTNPVEKTLSPYPKTARIHVGRLQVSTTTVCRNGFASGQSSKSWDALQCTGMVLDPIFNIVHGTVPATTAYNKIWIWSDTNVSTTWYVYGWFEDISEWL